MIDEMDRKIIKLLRQDGRASYTWLAHELGIEEITVTNRIRKCWMMRLLPSVLYPTQLRWALSHGLYRSGLEIPMLSSVCNKLVDIPRTSRTYSLREI